MTLALRDFVAARGVARSDVEAISDARLKSPLLHVALWSRAYVHVDDW